MQYLGVASTQKPLSPISERRVLAGEGASPAPPNRQLRGVWQRGSHLDVTAAACGGAYCAYREFLPDSTRTRGAERSGEHLRPSL